MAYRVTLHNRRVSNTLHNDRAFSSAREERAKESGNVYWHRGGGDMTFDEAELCFYEHNFRDALDEQNAKYIASGHKERCRTMDEYRKAKQTCPEESLYYFGNKEKSAPTVKLMKAFNKYMDWKRGRFPFVVAVDFALHRDEKGADHIHAREVWVAYDKKGNLIVSQNKALEQMGVERPDLSKPKSRYNNAKMTYSAECRAKWIEIAKEYGLEVIEVPKHASKSGLSLLDYQQGKAEEKLAVISQQIEVAEERMFEVMQNMSRAEQIAFRMSIDEPSRFIDDDMERGR